MGFFSMLFGGGDGDRDAKVKAAVADGARIVDVRTPEEFAGGHIDGALNIPVDVLGQRLGELGPKEKTLVVYCASGGRSARAAAFLQGAGYGSVIDVGSIRNFPR